MNKVQKIVKVDYEVADDITWQMKNTDFNFSAWVEAKYVEEFMKHKNLKDKIKKLQKELKNAQKVETRFIKKSEKWRHALKRNWSKERQMELEESRKIIKKNPGFLKGRLKLWNNKFKDNLSLTSWKLMLENEQ